MGAVIVRGTQTGAIWVALLFFGLLNERCVRARLWECEHFEAAAAAQCGWGAAPPLPWGPRRPAAWFMYYGRGLRQCAAASYSVVEVRALFRLLRTSCEK